MRKIVLFLTLGVLFTGPTVRSATVQVTFGSNFYQPSSVRIRVGDTVQWVRQSGSHDVESDFRTNNAAYFKSPFPIASSFSFAFNVAGTFTYRCNPHASLGMRGTVIVDPAPNSPPSVTITAPANGATFTSPAAVTVSASASDSDGSVTKIEFFDGATPLGSVASAQGSVVANLNAGSHSLTAKATDNQGATTTSTAVTVTVTAPNTPPTVSLTSPSHNVIIRAPGTITAAATASDPDGAVANVTFYRVVALGGPAVERQPLGSDSSAPYSVVLSDLPAGFYHLIVEATDNQGAVATSTEVVAILYTPIHIDTISPLPAGGVKLVVSGSVDMGQVKLEGSTDLNSWDSVSNATISGSAAKTVEIIDPTPGSVRFYRVQLLFQEAGPVLY